MVEKKPDEGRPALRAGLVCEEVEQSGRLLGSVTRERLLAVIQGTLSLNAADRAG